MTVSIAAIAHSAMPINIGAGVVGEHADQGHGRGSGDHLDRTEQGRRRTCDGTMVLQG
jgi:hypothetical protein